MHQMILQNSADQSDVVAFRIGDQDYCIDIDVVREIRGWSPTTVLPHAPPYVMGVINLRGNVVAVIDLAARLGLGKTQPTPRHVVVIVTFGHQTVGLMADVVSDILGIGEAELKPVPDVGCDTTRAFINNVITLEDGRILRKLELSEVLPRRAGEGA
jgi:purine-binding chemotaxis protein CheW